MCEDRGYMGNLLYLSLNFFANLKLLFKKIVLFFKKSGA